jgi:hypothetical protein
MSQRLPRHEMIKFREPKFAIQTGFFCHTDAPKARSKKRIYRSEKPVPAGLTRQIHTNGSNPARGDAERRGAATQCAEVFARPLRDLQALGSIGYNSRKLLSIIYPAADRARTWNQVYLAFFVVVRFKCCVQMIRSTLSKFENGINAR